MKDNEPTETTATTPPETEAAPAVEMPSASRVKRIEAILSADSAIKLGKKEVSLKGRDGTSQRFSKAVVDVTIALIKEGKEPYTALKKDVLNTAKKVLGLEEGEPTSPPSEPATAAVEGNERKPSKTDQTISIVSLLLSAANIAEIADPNPGAESRRKKLVEIKDDYVKAANIRISS